MAIARGARVHTRHAVDDALGALQSLQNRMALTRARVAFKAQIGVLHALVNTAIERRAEQVGQAEVAPPLAAFVIQRGFVGGHKAASAGHEFADLAALAVGKRGDIGEDQHLEPGGVVRVEQLVVHHFEWDARLHQRLVIAQSMVFHFLLRIGRVGKISTWSLAVWSASSNWSCTISNGMRASTNAW